MNSKRIFSAILAAVMTLSLVGCSQKDDKKITGDIEQPSFENGTAVVEYPSVNADGEEVVVTKVIETPSEYQSVEAKSDKAADNGTTADSAQNTTKKDNSASNGSDNSNGSNGSKTEATTAAQLPAVKVTFTNPLNNVLQTEDEQQEFINKDSNNYNISTEDAKKIVANSDKWTGFYCNVYIVNTNKQRLSTKEIQAESNGDIIIDKNLDCEFNMKPGNGMTITIYGYVNSEKYADDSDLTKALNDANIQLVYALTDETCVDDWSKVTTKTIKITV